MPENNPITEDIIIEGVGAFTPPPAPCGTDGCRYVLEYESGVEVGWVVRHVEDCDAPD